VANSVNYKMTHDGSSRPNYKSTFNSSLSYLEGYWHQSNDTKGE